MVEVKRTGAAVWPFFLPAGWVENVMAGGKAAKTGQEMSLEMKSTLHRATQQKLPESLISH